MTHKELFDLAFLNNYITETRAKAQSYKVLPVKTPIEFASEIEEIMEDMNKFLYKIMKDGMRNLEKN